MKVLVGLLCTLLLAPPATAQDAATTPPVGWQKLVDDYFEQELRDPYSAVRKVTRSPRQAVVKPDVWSSWSGWAVCYSVNAKNAYGAYIGARPYLFVVGDGRLLGVVKNTNDSMWFQGVIDRECANPAPEPVHSSKAAGDAT